MSPTSAALADISRREGCIRNAFRWAKGAGVVFPQERGATQEERRFLARYVTLFDEGFKDAKTDFAWRPWFEGDRLSFIGWRTAADGSVIGAELEAVAFLAEFPAVLADAAGPGFVLEVRDGAGGALFKTGETPFPVDETIEIYAFLEAASQSKKAGGMPVKIADVIAQARKGL